jgi:hypothetical protein
MLSPNLQIAPFTQGVIDAAVRNGMPIVSYDDYVILEDGTDLTFQFYHDLSTFRAATLKDRVPFWAFALSVALVGADRRPSESDLRWMQYSNLAYGAKGLWYFTYWGANQGDVHTAIVSNTGEKTELYDMVSAINHTVGAVGDTLLGLTSVEVVHTKPPGGEKAFASGAQWISDIQASDALIGFFKDASGTPYALVVNKKHGKGLSAAATADTIQLTFDANVASGAEAVSWLDGKTGPLEVQDQSATLQIAGGTGVLLKALPPAPPSATPEPAPDAGTSSAVPSSAHRGCAVRASPANTALGWLALGALGVGVASRRRRAARRSDHDHSDRDQSDHSICFSHAERPCVLDPLPLRGAPRAPNSSRFASTASGVFHERERHSLEPRTGQRQAAKHVAIGDHVVTHAETRGIDCRTANAARPIGFQRRRRP